MPFVVNLIPKQVLPLEKMIQIDRYGHGTTVPVDCKCIFCAYTFLYMGILQDKLHITQYVTLHWIFLKSAIYL